MTTTSNPRFLVAKYARDERRMEPRNFGVVLWHEGRAYAKFAGEFPESSGKVRPPASLGVRDSKAYAQWVAYWRRCLVVDTLRIGRRSAVGRSSEEFLDVLQATSRGNYMLVDGGYIFDPVAPNELPNLLGYLYEQLVATESEEEKSHESTLLSRSVGYVLKASGISARDDLQRKWPAPCLIHGVAKSYDFDYAIGDTGKPDLLIHKVLLTHEKTFDSFVLNLQGLYDGRKDINKNRVCAMVYINGTAGNPDVQSNLAILDRMATPLDVHNEEQAQGRLRQLLATAT